MLGQRKLLAKDAALLKRHQQAVILSHMMLTILLSLQKGYRRKHIGRVLPELMVSFVVRANDGDGGEPLSVSEIMRRVGMPRESVNRDVKTLLARGMLRENGKAYCGDLDFLRARLNPPYWADCVGAILTAADELRALEPRHK